ncbi:unnamed protein product, partial [Ixodes pacificus]
MRLVLVSVFAFFYVTAGLNLCPHQKHLEGAIDKCHGKLSKLGEISKQLADIASTYEKQCAEELAPGASSAEIQRMRCVDHYFEKQFHRCWAGVLDDDRLLVRSPNALTCLFREKFTHKMNITQLSGMHTLSLASQNAKIDLSHESSVHWITEHGGSH